MIRRTTLTAALAGLACAAATVPAAAHAADAWRPLGTTVAPLATDGDRLVVTAPEPGRLLVRDDRTGKAWRLALPAGCTFTGIVGGGGAAVECGSLGGEVIAGPLREPILLDQPRYVRVGLRDGTARPVPPLWGGISNGGPRPQLMALGSRWAEFLVHDYHSVTRQVVRLADGAQQDDPLRPDVAPDLGTAAEQGLQPLCAPVRRPAASGSIETVPVPQVARGGRWIAFVRQVAGRTEVAAWRCGAPRPVVLASCGRAICSQPVLGGGLASFGLGTVAQVSRLRDGRTVTLESPPALAGVALGVAHTRRHVYVTGRAVGPRSPSRVFRRAAPKP